MFNGTTSKNLAARILIPFTILNIVGFLALYARLVFVDSRITKDLVVLSQQVVSLHADFNKADWSRSHIESLTAKTIEEYISQFGTHSVKYTDSMRDKFIPSFVVKIGAHCLERVSGSCVGKEVIEDTITILSDKNWADGKDHLFYLSSGAEGQEEYYDGPYIDNLAALKAEADRQNVAY